MPADQRAAIVALAGRFPHHTDDPRGCLLCDVLAIVADADRALDLADAVVVAAANLYPATSHNVRPDFGPDRAALRRALDAYNKGRP